MTAGVDMTAWLRDDNDGSRLIVELDNARRESAGDDPFNVIVTGTAGMETKLYVSLADLRSFHAALGEFIARHEPAPDDPPF